MANSALEASIKALPNDPQEWDSLLLANKLVPILLALLSNEGDLEDIIGNLSDLETDHKSKLVDAINELADLVEKPNYVISFTTPTADLKAIYDQCKNNLVLAKNIVFYNAETELYYLVNGYNMVSDVLKLHTIMQGESGLVDTTINLASNGSLSVG